MFYYTLKGGGKKTMYWRLKLNFEIPIDVL